MEEALKIAQEHPYLILMTGVAISLVLGLIPLILGIKRNRRNLGIAAFVAALLLSPVPLLAIISIVIFTIVILVKSNPAKLVAVNGKTVDVSANSPKNP